MRTYQRLARIVVATSLLAGPPALASEAIPEAPGTEILLMHTPPSRKPPHERREEARLPDDFSKPWWEWQRATGDWGGARPWLDERGLVLDATYIGEVFSNLRGGINTEDAAEYRGNFDLIATLHTGGLGLWDGGTLFVYLQNGHGRGISEDHVGDVQVLSNIDADPFTQVSECWLEQRLFEQRVRLKLGKQDGNADFVGLDSGGDFVHSSVMVIPTVPIPTFPDPALGAVIVFDPAEWISLGVGVYDGDSSGSGPGFDTAFDGKGGAFALAELTLRPSGAGGAWSSGAYRLGAWFHSDDVEEISDAAEPRVFSDNHGLYLAFEQRLFQERGPGNAEQGLAAFAQFGWAPSDRNALTRYYGGGLVYDGLVPRRDRDVLGVAVAHVEFSSRVTRLEGRDRETAVEVFYKAQLTPFLSVQPDLQFIVNPGGEARDALALGVRFVIDF